MFVLPNKQEDPEGNGHSDITEVKQIKQIVFCEPQGHSDGLKNDKNDKRMQVFSDMFHARLHIFDHRTISDIKALSFFAKTGGIL